MKRIHLILSALIFGLFVYAGVHDVVNTHNKVQLKEIQLKDTSVRLKQVNQKYDQLLQQKNVNEDEIKQLQQQKQDLEKQVQSKADEKRVAAERLQKAAQALSATKTAYAASGSVSSCSGNPDADYIYMHESGCNPSAINASGCRGIGQACPGSKLPCGADFACQHAYFSQYAAKYGGWAGARAFWQAHHWW